MRLFQIKRRRPERVDGLGLVESAGPARVFVTGATGYLGRAVVAELVAAGHDVVGMTRWAERTLLLRALGARAVVGDAHDSTSYRRVAAAYDVLVHLGADREPRRAAADAGAVESLLWAAAQREPGARDEPPRLVVYTSGCFVLGDTGAGPADEATPPDPPEHLAWRPALENRVLAAATPDLATAVIRPGIVYGGAGGRFAAIFASAVECGAAEYVGDGRNRWSPVYLGDVARLYRLVIEHRGRGVFHATEGRGVPVAELAAAASEAAGCRGATRAVPLDEARRTHGTLADALVLDQSVASARAEALGWRRRHPPFLESAGSVFAEWRAAVPAAGSLR